MEETKVITVKVATSNTRGFLKGLFEYPNDDIEFRYKEENIYEVRGGIRDILTRIIKWPVFDILGVFQVVKTYNVTEDICFSYNRFLKTDKPYVILLENPSALVNYCWDRPKWLIAKKKLKKCFTDPHLKGIVCMSKACFRYIYNLYNIPPNVRVIQNYPFVFDDMNFTYDDVKAVANQDILNCIYVSSNFELKGGRDILYAIKRLNMENIPIKVTVITRIDTISENDLSELNKLDNTTIVDFILSKEELNEYYKNAAVLLNPTRGDSFSLVTLEAIKYGCAILATDIYAIKEMNIDNYNGFLTKSMFKIWDEDGTLNKYYRTHQKELVLNGTIDEAVVDWLYKKLKLLAFNRSILEKMCINSLKLARETDFSAKKVMEKWKKIFNESINI